MRSLVPLAVPIVVVVLPMRSPVPLVVPVVMSIIVVVMVMSPGPIRIPVRAVIPAAHDHGRRRGNYDRCRNPNAHGHAHSGVSQER
jgi:hypothetical protein